MIWTLKNLSLAIKNQLEVSFNNIEVSGEVCKPMTHSSGHTYFVLKDNEYTINCIIWRTTFCSVKAIHGSQMVCTGNITTYSSRSQYQMIISQIRHTGRGELLQLFNSIKQKFNGLKNLHPIPSSIKKIAILTSIHGAVIFDMLAHLSDKYIKQVDIFHIAVQGSNVVSSIQNVLSEVKHDTDLVIIARGGGSFEDLWEFNNEMLCKSIVQYNKPIISAIGHESDFTILDYVASQRASTPTAAMQYILRKQDLLQIIHNKKKITEKHFMQFCMHIEQKRILNKNWLFYFKECIQYLRSKLMYAKEKYFSPPSKFRLIPKKMTKYTSTLTKKYKSFLQERMYHLKLLKQNIQNCSYITTLQRGFCLVTNNKNEIIYSTHQTQQDMILHFYDGSTRVKLV